MRFIDFFVFYINTLYRNKRRGNLYWESALGRTSFVVGLIFTFLLFSIAEVIAFLIARINIIANRASEIVVIFIGFLLVQLLRHIYIVKKRYEFITSSEYDAFNLSSNLGVLVCVLTFILSFILSIAIGVLINIFLKSHGVVELK